MIAASRSVAAIALAVAAMLHGLGLARVHLTPPVEIAGGQVGIQEASLGTAFADLAQGALTAIETEDVSPPVPIAPAAATLYPQASTQPKPLQPVRPEDTLVAAPTPPSAAPVRQTRTAKRQAILAPVSPPDHSAANAQAPTEALTARDPDKGAPNRSPRPPARPRTIARAETPPAPRGNRAEVNARAGQADRRATTPGGQSTGPPAAARSGNAAASNYPGLVMQRIQRVRQPGVRARGAATVAFRIASNGGVRAVSIAQSSGSAALDRAALDVIRRAAPFPQPPQGAQRSFSVQIRAR